MAHQLGPRILAEHVDDPRPHAPGGAGEAVARVRARAAKVEPGDRSAVARPAEQRAHGEELVERQLAVEDVAAGQAVSLFQIQRRDDLAVEDKT